MDIRLDVEFFNHPKTVKLERALSFEGIRSLLKLWIWAAKNRPDGDFQGLDNDDIEIAAQWGGSQGELLSELVKIGWLDEYITEQTGPTFYKLHNWSYRNGWVADSMNRSDKARLSRLAYTYPEVYRAAVADGLTAITREEYERRISEYNTSTTLTTLQRQKISTSLTADNASLTTGYASNSNGFNDSTSADAPSTNVNDRRPYTNKARQSNGFNDSTSVDVRSTPAPAPAPAQRVSDLEGLSTQLYTELCTRYPELPVLQEIKTALEWKDSKRMHIDNYKGFFIDWLNRKRAEKERER